ncbi:MAG: hypothetical protein HUJ29_10735 [Gammaproteobacteria bacterium]|nr:hypothetical protein [Gammaproteobacteria bacterium]
MDLCVSNKALAQEVADFLVNVSDVNEESITDYLVWRWKEIDKRFKAINISTFTRQEESKISGADFEMELWLVGKTKRYPLVFQAKKFIKPYASYVRKLRYPDNTKQQMNKLLSYAASNNKIPFYVFYSLPDTKTKTMCMRNNISNSGVFMGHAKIIEEFADGKHGSRVSLNKLLENTNPFHCIFCCPLAHLGGYFEKYFPVSASTEQDQTTPGYVNYLLETHRLEINNERVKSLIEQYNLGVYRYVAVYDLRDVDETPNKAL